jgi:iron(III) transport system substrate-binding protein
MRAAALVLLAACACGKTEPPPAPGPRRAIVVHCGRSEVLLAPIFARHEYETGVDLQIRYGDSAKLAQALLEGAPADVFLAQDAHSLAALEARGLLAKLPEAVLGSVDAAARSPGGAWVGTSGRANVLVYNTGRVAAGAIPSIADLALPRWKGKVGWAPAHGSFQAFVEAMVALDGEEPTRAWLTAMAANEPRAFPSNTPLVAAVARGEIDAGLANHYHLAALRHEQPDLAAGNHFYRNRRAESLVVLSGAAVLAATKDLESAVALVAFLVDAKAQAQLAQQNHELVTRGGAIDGLAPPPLPPAAPLRAAALLRETGVLPR